MNILTVSMGELRSTAETEHLLPLLILRPGKVVRSRHLELFLRGIPGANEHFVRLEYRSRLQSLPSLTLLNLHRVTNPQDAGGEGCHVAGETAEVLNEAVANLFHAVERKNAPLGAADFFFRCCKFGVFQVF